MNYRAVEQCVLCIWSKMENFVAKEHSGVGLGESEMARSNQYTARTIKINAYLPNK